MLNSRRLRKINSATGDARDHILKRYQEGETVDGIAADLTMICNEPVSKETVYAWLRQWRAEQHNLQEVG